MVSEIFKYDDPNKPELLIDGLQRSTSLFKFVHNPSEFFDEDDIDEKIIEELAKMANSMGSTVGIKNDIKSKIINWVKSFKTSAEVRDMNEFVCATTLVNEMPIFFIDAQKNGNQIEVLSKIATSIKPIFDNYKKLCITIEEKPVPYIEITGDDTNLSDIFFRINDRGVKLNKQNKFAATWSNSPVKIENEKLKDLVTIVRDRYDEIQREGTSIYGYNSQTFLQKQELDVFELTYAFGKYITKNYPNLFSNKNDIVVVDSIGFVLINACLMGTKETLPEMNKLLFERIGKDKVNEFLVKILTCIKYVDDLLGPVTKFKGNKRLSKSPLHTDFQIVSLIASVFRLKHVKNENDKYIFDFSNLNNNWYTADTKIQKHALKRYIYDIIDGYWTAHGDNSLDIIIHENPETYTEEISKAEFKAVLYKWYSRQKNDRKEYSAKDVKAPAEPEKVLLNLIYSNSFTAASQLNIEKFDIEHLATKKLMEIRLKKYNSELKLPISSIGNLCLLPEYTNRKKQADTIYMDKEYIDKLGNEISLEEIENKFTFTTKKSMEWLNNDNLSKEEFAEEYTKFIEERFDIMTDKIISILYHY